MTSPTDLETPTPPTEHEDGESATEQRVDVGAAIESEPEASPTIPDRLPVLPIRSAVAFPGTVMPLQIGRERSKRVLDLALAGDRMVALVAQKSADTEVPGANDLRSVGTACAVLKMLKMEDGTEHIIVQGLERVSIRETHEIPEGYLEAAVTPHRDPDDITVEQKALSHTIRTGAERMIELSENIPDEARQVVSSIQRPGALADFLAANLPIDFAQRQELLETFDVTERLKKVNLLLTTQLEVVELSDKIQQKVRSQIDQTQREYYLREQMKAIQSELGESEGGQAGRLEELRERVKKSGMPEDIQAEALREVDRLQTIPQASPEYSMTFDYVEWLADLPWQKSTEDMLDIQRAEKILDEDHYDLEKVKKRILEYLAVRQLRGGSRGPILCFVGPPGVGKTSLGQSIARAMNREFIRLSLGGVRDEATIRGHRRTYIGSMPGRIIREIRRAGVNNPVFMIDEVDKISQGIQGDPMSALLEVLDPAQNGTFTDHYLGVPFDLSKVVFIGTANYVQAIEPALRDRMEMIELSSYTHREKLMIAKNYLVPRQLEENGLSPEQVRFDEETLSAIISNYTRESGVRSLERQIGAVCRALAAKVVKGQSIEGMPRAENLEEILGPRQHESEVAATEGVPGVATGLAFTPTGGEILFIEAKTIPGGGQLKLTGQLGDVMRESAVAAASIIRSAPELAGNVTWDRFHFHVHVPAGAIPKDGPSAGVAMLTAMASALTDQAVDPKVGMTGEITLSGRVLPVGGIREKVVAAHRAGLKCVILPRRNQAQLADVPEEVRNELEFVFVDTVEDVLGYTFDRGGGRKKTRTAARKKKAGRSTKASKKKKRPKARKAGSGKKKKKPRRAARRR